VIKPGDTSWYEARRPFILRMDRYDPADALHTSFPYHLTAAGTEAVEA
jgi:hypothetical protein